MEGSRIDELYRRLTGKWPTKDGEAYERIATAVLGMLTNAAPGEALHNQFLSGQSGSVYQLDGLINGKWMVEAKDYTVRNAKVGRGDLQKLEGALTDLPQIDKGIIASSTDFTRPAKQYAKGSESNKMQKPIHEAHIRPCQPSDMEGRIQTIVVNLQCVYPDFDKGKYSCIFTDEGMAVLKALAEKKGSPDFEIGVEFFFDADGNMVDSMASLSRRQQPHIPDGATTVSGAFEIEAMIKVEGTLVGIKGISYEIPVERFSEKIEIKADGSPEILVKCDALGLNKIITDKELACALKSNN